LATGFGAGLAVVHLVLATFFSTVATGLRTDAANLLGELAVTGHERGGECTQVGAVSVKLDAAGHHFHVVFAQTGCSAGFTSDGAVGTRLDACVEFGIEHWIPPWSMLRAAMVRPFSYFVPIALR
jgi:hypothetical protein|tara:strand:+ start:2335 stop:2709 length:375 start_codon:yes stop_codon:yes gene_type:complete